MPRGKKAKAQESKDHRSDRDRLIDAALQLAATERWRDITLSRIAEHAGLDIGVVIMTLPGRTRILCALMDRIDDRVFTSLGTDPLDGTTKDRLFDLLMRRFDSLQGHRDAMVSIIGDLMRDPLTSACLGVRFLKSMALTLQAGGVSSKGCIGHIRAKALGVVQLNATRVWLTDSSDGLERTMATLDKGLRLAERLAGGGSAVS